MNWHVGVQDAAGLNKLPSSFEARRNKRLAPLDDVQTAATGFTPA